MRIIARGDFQGTNAELLALIVQRIANFKAALVAHAATVGTPAPREEDLIEDLANSDELFEIEPVFEKEREPTAEEIAAQAVELDRLNVLRADVLAQELLGNLITATPQQISSYVDNNVVDLPSARLMFKRVLLVLALIAR